MGGKSSDVGPGRVGKTPSGEITDEVKSRIAKDFSRNLHK